ncbi:MAG: hypothetical protein B6243_07630 [Anaerolineaceae bacterium 4572_5.2]|nr:MAG: hypothetical protein B6243_07630 [Anaerolineaceae bacterium 4572_5.2]
MGASKNIAELSLSARLEGLLFVASEPISVTHLGTALEMTTAKIERGLKELDESLASRGLRLQRHRGRVQLTTAPNLSAFGFEITDSRLKRAGLDYWQHINLFTYDSLEEFYSKNNFPKISFPCSSRRPRRRK